MLALASTAVGADPEAKIAEALWWRGRLLNHEPRSGLDVLIPSTFERNLTTAGVSIWVILLSIRRR